jgi:hypothetical protein
MLHLLVFALALCAGAGAAPVCTPFAPSVGHWDFPEGGGMQWDPGGAANSSAACEWSTPSLRDLARCLPGATLVFGGDSVIRYMLTTLGLEAWRCGAEGVEATPLREKACNTLYGLKEKKGDDVILTPPEWGPENLTMHFRYLRFGYEFLDRAAAWQPDHFGDPAAATAILLGGMGYWDARYRTHDTLLNVLERLGEDMEPLFARNPTLRGKLTVLSTTYSENYDSRMNMFPHDILDAVNAAAAPVWRAMGVPWFDVTRYVRAAGPGAASEDLAGRMAYSGGKLLTQDGYHPTVEVQRVILREVFSHWCEAATQGMGGAAAPLPPRSPTGGAGRREDKLLALPQLEPFPQHAAGAGAWGGGASELDAAGLVLLPLLSCLCCLSARGKRWRKRCCTACGVRCGCLL